MNLLKSLVLAVALFVPTAIAPRTVSVSAATDDKPSTYLGAANNVTYRACKSPNQQRFSIWVENNNSNLRLSNIYMKEPSDPDKTGLTGGYIARWVKPSSTFRSPYLEKVDWQAKEFLFRSDVKNLDTGEEFVDRSGPNPHIAIDVDAYPVCFWNQSQFLFRENLVTFRACVSPDRSGFKIFMYSRHEPNTTVENVYMQDAAVRNAPDDSGVFVADQVVSRRAFRSNYLSAQDWEGKRLLFRADVINNDTGDSYQARMSGQTTPALDTSTFPTCYTRLGN